MSIAIKALNWLDERLPVRTMMGIADKKTVPLHKHSFWYYMGGIALVIFMVQLVTGVLLMVHYIPEIASAHASILKINTQIEFGWFMRSFHSWGANLMIVALMVHMFSAYFMKAYRKPRELTWVTGIGLLGLAFVFGFTGYLLPWDEVAFFATKIGIDIPSKMPIVGPYIAELMRGGSVIGQSTLSRFFVIHVFVLPLALIGLLGIHLLFIQLHGISEPESFKKLPSAKKRVEKFFPTFVLKDVMIWLLVINFLALLVTFAPWGLGSEADPFAPAPAGIKPEWYFLAMFQILKFVPPHIGPIEGELVGMGFFGLIAAVFALIPFIDRSEDSPVSAWATWFGRIVLVGFIAFTVWGYIS